MQHDNHKKEQRAKLLDEASCLVFKVHHNLQWVNHYTPDTSELKKFVGHLEAVINSLNKVIDDRLFDPPHKFIDSK